MKILVTKENMSDEMMSGIICLMKCPEPIKYDDIISYFIIIQCN